MDELATAFSQTRSVIQSVLNRRPRLEQVQMKQSKRSRLSSAEKLQVLHYHSIGMKPFQIQSKFKISPRTFYRILESKENLRERDSNGESVNSKGAPHPKHPELESRVPAFVAFARYNRMPVSKSLIQERP